MVDPKADPSADLRVVLWAGQSVDHLVDPKVVHWAGLKVGHSVDQLADSKVGCLVDPKAGPSADLRVVLKAVRLVGRMALMWVEEEQKYNATLSSHSRHDPPLLAHHNSCSTLRHLLLHLLSPNHPNLIVARY